MEGYLFKRFQPNHNGLSAGASADDAKNFRAETHAKCMAHKTLLPVLTQAGKAPRSRRCTDLNSENARR